MGWHLLFVETALPPPTAALPPLALRGLAPVSAAGRKPCRARRHEAQHSRVAPLRRRTQWHTQHDNRFACITNCHFCMDPIRKEGIPKYLSWRQGSGEVANGWRRPPPQWHRRHPSNRLQTRKQLQGGVPTLSIPFTSLNLILVGTIEFGFFRIHFNYEML